MKKLFEQYTPEELAESFVFPVKLTKKQREARQKIRAELTPQQKMQMDMVMLKLRMDDALKVKGFNREHSFGNFLRQYIKIIGLKHKTFAAEISITPAELSQLINGHRNPNEIILIRLEIHSGKLFPAITWYKLLEKEREHVLRTDTVLRKKERKNVKHSLAFAS